MLDISPFGFPFSLRLSFVFLFSCLIYWVHLPGEASGTTVTLVVVDGWTVTVASVGDSRCILESQGGVVSLLTVDHRLEENVEERERVTASGGEVGRLNLCGGQEVRNTGGLQPSSISCQKVC